MITGGCLHHKYYKFDSTALEKFQTLQTSERSHGAQFVPRRDATAEDDGYILLLLHNGETGGTEFAILDAQRISDGAARVAPGRAFVSASCVVCQYLPLEPLPRCQTILRSVGAASLLKRKHVSHHHMVTFAITAGCCFLQPAPFG